MRTSNPTDGIPAVVPERDRAFRTLTAQARRALGVGATGEAEDACLAAAEEAERLFTEGAVRGGRVVLIAPMAVVVAACNLANLRLAHGEPARARALVERAAERLVAAAESAAVPLTMRLNCLRHLRPALHALADLNHAQGGRGDGASLLAERTARIAPEVIRIAELLAKPGPVAETAAAHPGNSIGPPAGRATPVPGRAGTH